MSQRGTVGSVSLQRAGAAALLAGAGLAGLGGCETDSFLNPSVVGYWEHTPTVTPILTRLGPIEDSTAEFVETSPVSRDDLIAEAQAYRLGPSDELEIKVDNLTQVGRPDQFTPKVDQRGYISLPRTGPLYVMGRTENEVQAIVARAIEDAGLIKNPTVSVVVTAERAQTFSIIGAVRTPGTYFIPKPDYRLLEALTAAGGFDENLTRVLVIRQVPLSDEARGRIAPPPEPTRPVLERTPAQPPEKILPLIDELTQPKAPAVPGPSQPGTTPPPPPPAPPGSLGAFGGQPAGDSARTGGTPVPLNPQREPPIDLEDQAKQKATPAAGAADAQPSQPSHPGKPRSKWVFLNGQWIKEAASGPGAAKPSLPESPNPMGSGAAKDLLTQRVIEVPIPPLVAGQADVNIVIRPGDVVRVPSADAGLVYVSGNVARPGTYSLPSAGRLTILRALAAAGGLSETAYPERVDLTRMVGKDREATIRLNVKAIGERTQPDVYLKPDDHINVGTNFFMVPLAVFRSGLRASYGFGFILDRNFAGDVFGLDPALGRR